MIRPPVRGGALGIAANPAFRMPHCEGRHLRPYGERYRARGRCCSCGYRTPALTSRRWPTACVAPSLSRCGPVEPDHPEAARSGLLLVMLNHPRYGTPVTAQTLDCEPRSRKPARVTDRHIKGAARALGSGFRGRAVGGALACSPARRRRDGQYPALCNGSRPGRPTANESARHVSDPARHNPCGRRWARLPGRHAPGWDLHEPIGRRPAPRNPGADIEADDVEPVMAAVGEPDPAQTGGFGSRALGDRSAAPQGQTVCGPVGFPGMGLATAGVGVLRQTPGAAVARESVTAARARSPTPGTDVFDSPAGESPPKIR